MRMVCSVRPQNLVLSLKVEISVTNESLQVELERVNVVKVVLAVPQTIVHIFSLAHLVEVGERRLNIDCLFCPENVR